MFCYLFIEKSSLVFLKECFEEGLSSIMLDSHNNDNMNFTLCFQAFHCWPHQDYLCPEAKPQLELF